MRILGRERSQHLRNAIQEYVPEPARFVVPCGFSPWVPPIVASDSQNQMRDELPGMISCSTGTTAIIALSGFEPEAAQGLQVLDGSQRSLRRRRVPKTIAAPAPPEQEARPARVTG